MGKGGGQPSQQTVTNTNVPEYLQPFMMDLANRAQAASMTPYQKYGGERVAGFTPDQFAVQQETAQMGTPGQFRTASDFATTAGLGALEASRYAPAQVSVDRINTPILTQYQMQAPERVGATGVTSRDIQAAQTGFSPQLERFQMTEPGAFTGETAQQ